MNRIVRTFLAVEISSETRMRAGQLIERLETPGAKIKWVEPHNLHLTLKFLGDVDLLEIPAVCRAVTQTVGELPPFEIEARGAGAFPDADHPRTVWLGMAAGTEPMAALHDAVERSLAPLGFRREHRRFRPHLNIGRVRGGGPGIRELAARLKEQADFAGGISSVDEVVVFSSELGRDGPKYEVLATAPLDGA